eukprot:2285810-Amphidinium_carterae.1
MDPEGRNTKLKIELQRQQQASEALKGCTFKPEIDQHSEEIVNSRSQHRLPCKCVTRISRLKVTGALHDQLYEDAQRRRERLAHYSTMVPLGVTFQPDIGANHYRPPNDDTQECRDADVGLAELSGGLCEQTCLLQELFRAVAEHEAAARRGLGQKQESSISIKFFTRV